MKPLENSVGKGDEVNFVIAVIDSDSQPITDVKIYGSMIYPDGTHKHTFQVRLMKMEDLFFLYDRQEDKFGRIKN